MGLCFASVVDRSIYSVSVWNIVSLEGGRLVKYLVWWVAVDGSSESGVWFL